MKLPEYLDGMASATTAAELEAAIRAPSEHRFSGPTWRRICKVRIEAAHRICDAHPHGRFVPRFGTRRLLTVCGETFRVGHGQNSTGIRYAWHDAQQWAEQVLRDNGLSRRAAYGVWSTAFDYPHRALAVIDDALAGRLPDPRFNRLIYRGRCSTGTPVRVNRRTEAEHRAHRPCKCGGLLWDWGCGWNGYANYIEWRCDRCPRLYTEYLTDGRLGEIRSRPAKKDAAA
jgi:hypothetical protein